MTKQLQPITKQLLDSMSSYNKTLTLKKYHAWLKDVRKKDKKFAYNNTNKLFKKLKLYNEKFYISSSYINIEPKLLIEYRTHMDKDGKLTENEYLLDRRWKK